MHRMMHNDLQSKHEGHSMMHKKQMTMLCPQAVVHTAHAGLHDLIAAVPRAASPIG
jgi:hypothetical protein